VIAGALEIWHEPHAPAVPAWQHRPDPDAACRRQSAGGRDWHAAVAQAGPSWRPEAAAQPMQADSGPRPFLSAGDRPGQK
jgi:hypothetical protein